MTSKPNQSDIKNYFNFSNSNWKKLHLPILVFEIINLAIIIIFFIFYTLTTFWKFTSVSLIIGIFIITIFLFIYKKAWYRYLSYIFVIFGMVFAVYITYFMNFPPERIIFERLLMGLFIICVIVDLIFLLNYVSIEFSQRGAKTGTLKEYGIFIGIKRNI